MAVVKIRFCCSETRYVEVELLLALRRILSPLFLKMLNFIEIYYVRKTLVVENDVGPDILSIGVPSSSSGTQFNNQPTRLTEFLHSTAMKRSFRTFSEQTSWNACPKSTDLKDFINNHLM